MRESLLATKNRSRASSISLSASFCICSQSSCFCVLSTFCWLSASRAITKRTWLTTLAIWIEIAKHPATPVFRNFGSFTTSRDHSRSTGTSQRTACQQRYAHVGDRQVVWLQLLGMYEPTFQSQSGSNPWPISPKNAAITLSYSKVNQFRFQADLDDSPNGWWPALMSEVRQQVLSPGGHGWPFRFMD